MFTLLSAWYQESTNAAHQLLIYYGINFIDIHDGRTYFIRPTNDKFPHNGVLNT